MKPIELCTGFMSQDNWRSNQLLESLFLSKEGFVWFVESIESEKWITQFDNCSDEDCLTNDPNNAHVFKTEISADTYIIRNELNNRFIATEHEFVDS